MELLVADAVPLVVDLDGTLIRTDLLIESFLALAATRPGAAVTALGRLRQGRAALKAELADHAIVDLHTLPFDDEVLAYIRAARAAGRKVYLASASDRRLVEGVAAHLGLFDGAFGSDQCINLAGPAKAAALAEAFPGGFDYLGDDPKADLPVWDRCRVPMVAGPALARRLRPRYPRLQQVGGAPSRLTDHLRALRPHQWLKNLLVFVPLVAAHALDPQAIGAAALAFVAFSLCASSVYLLNDLLDLAADRRHHSKKWRPLACGRMPLLHAAGLAPVLLVAAAALGGLLGGAFLGVLAAYCGLSLLYSVALKRLMLADVMTLAVLYTVRLFAGGIACAIPISPWLMGFSVFLFLCLAMVKRTTELVRHPGNLPPGRGYAASDLPMLESLAAAAGYGAVVVLALYINGPDVHALYRHPEFLWAACLLLLYWVSRVLMLAHRGRMDDDPVIFAIRDRASLMVGAGVLAIVALAA